MPRLNTFGVIGAGIGGSIVSLWKPSDAQPTPIAVNAGGACWLDNDHLLYQRGSQLETCRVSNGQIDTVDIQGSYELAAGGGVYAAKFSDGVRISTNLAARFELYGVGDVAPDGDVLLKRPDGTFHDTGRVLADPQALGARQWSALDEHYRPICSAGVVNVAAVPGRIYGLRRRGDYAVYFAEDGGRLIVQYVDRPVGCVVVAGLSAAYRPDLAAVGGSLILSYATSEEEAPEHLRRFTVSIAALTESLGATAPPPIVIPPPQPPKPEPPPVAESLPSAVLAIRDRFVAQYPVPQMAGSGPSDDAFENICRAWVLKLAQTVVALTNDRTWGVKNAGGGRPQSKDSLAHWDKGRLVNFDLLSGVGTGHPSLVGSPSGEDITGQVFMPVEPLNWLAGAQPDPPKPADPPPAPQPDPELAHLQAEIDDLVRRLRVVEAKPDPVVPPAPDLSGYAKKGDPVTVRASLPWVGNITGKGSIDK